MDAGFWQRHGEPGQMGMASQISSSIVMMIRNTTGRSQWLISLLTKHAGLDQGPRHRSIKASSDQGETPKCAPG